MENRKEPRIRSRGPVELWLEDQECIAGTIYDISIDGLSVSAAEEIGPGAHIRIVGTGFTAEATVRHCRPDGSEFRIGMALLPPG